MILEGKIFDGEEMKEDINVITKLRTHSRQHYPEKEDGSSWVINPDHLIKAVKFWKMKDHICLRGIRFPDIMDFESRSSLTDTERRDNEEKVVKSWKYFTSKPYHLLVKYHKNLAKELGRSSEESDYEETYQSDESFDTEMDS